MTPTPRQHSRRAGFSFVELLFAMAVLSIGMLGIAAAVYVGIDQTRSTVDETTAAAIARQAVATLGQVMTKENALDTNGNYQSFVPPPNATPPPPPTLQDVTAGLQICASDPRFAWLALYRRKGDEPTAEVIVVVLRSEARPAFDSRDLLDADGPSPGGPFPASLVPDEAAVIVANNQVQIRSPSGTERVGPNTVLVLHNMQDSKLNGRILRVAGPGDAGAWELAPSQDARDVTATQNGSASVIGRGYTDPTQPQRGYSGLSQPVAVYASIVMLR